MPKYRVEINSGKGIDTDKTELEFDSREELVSELSRLYGGKISLADEAFINTHIYNAGFTLSNVIAPEDKKSLDKVNDPIGDLYGELGDIINGQDARNLPPLNGYHPSECFKIYVDGPTGLKTSIMPLRESEVEIFNQKISASSAEVDRILSQYDGINPDDYVAGKELSIEDISKLEISNYKYEMDMLLNKGVSTTTMMAESIFIGYPGRGVLGSSPDFLNESGDTPYTPEQGRILFSALPTIVLEYQANRMADIQISHKEKLEKNYSPQAEREAKLAYLRQAAKLKPITSQCIMVVEDKDMFGLGTSDTSKAYTNGTDDIIGPRSSIRAMDGHLEMIDAGIRRGWTVNDLDTLGRLEYYSRRTESLEKGHSKFTEQDRNDLKEFRDLISKIKTTDIHSQEERLNMLNSVAEKLNSFSENIRNASISVYNSVKRSVDDTINRKLSAAEISEIGNLGPIKAELDKIEVKSFSKEQMAELKERTLRDMEYASSTLQAKGQILDADGKTTSSVSSRDAIDAYRGILEKNDSFFHWDSKQFKAIKAGLQKVQNGTATVKERKELTQNVKNWLTDTKYNRAEKHSRSNFNNTRFNDMFALANELDPKWAHENFSKMNLCGLHGDRAEETKFESIDDFLNYKQKQIINNNCLKNSEAQKGQEWYQEGYSPQQEAMIREVERTWKSPEYTDMMRIQAEKANLEKINNFRIIPGLKEYHFELSMWDLKYRTEKNKTTFQTKKKDIVEKTENYLKDLSNRRNKEEYNTVVAIYGVLEPVKANKFLKELKAANMENSGIRKIDLATLEKEKGLDIGGRKDFRKMREAHRQANAGTVAKNKAPVKEQPRRTM